MGSGHPGAAFVPRLPSPLYALTDDRLSKAGVQLYLKRDDLIHPEIPGNKWRKLKYNLQMAREQGYKTLLTFGGAYSNHIRATAAAGHYFGFSTIGVIRGEEHQPLNDTLIYASSRGMRLAYLDRGTYRRKTDRDVVAGLRDEFGDFYLLPEGGSNAAALRGCAELPDEIDVSFDVICCPVGTGGTLAGIAQGLASPCRALGVAVLKGGQFLTGEVRNLQAIAFGGSSRNWEISYDFHFGGFAKRARELDSFILNFYERHGVRLEWTYVAKMMYGVFALIGYGAFEPGVRLVAVITGPEYDLPSEAPMPGT